VSQRRPRATLVVHNAGELLTCRADAPDLIGRVAGGAVAVAGERIVAAGAEAEVLAAVETDGARMLDAGGRVVLPGFVDSHTHLLFGGSRVDEYAAKLTGADLAPLREAGLPVGIVGTVRETRALSEEELATQALPRLREMLLAGTTTVESKSGYGLTTESELRMLRANRLLAERQPIDVVSTFLGAHAFPPGQDHDDYVETIIAEMIPRVAEEGLATFCDVYCDEGYFTPEQSRRILEAGLAAGMRPKIHLDQYSHTGAAGLTADLGCVSADHMNFTTPAEIAALAAAGVVGVPTPALDFAVAHPRPVDVRALLAGGMTVAIATDCCPGCWLTSMPFVIVLACRLHGLSVAEAIRAATLGGAAALTMADEVGSLAPGMLADLLILDVDRHEDLAYRLGRNPVATVVKRGRVVVEAGNAVA
jgi:imidazolonepropionase